MDMKLQSHRRWASPTSGQPPFVHPLSHTDQNKHQWRGYFTLKSHWTVLCIWTNMLVMTSRTLLYKLLSHPCGLEKDMGKLMVSQHQLISRPTFYPYPSTHGSHLLWVHIWVFGYWPIMDQPKGKPTRYSNVCRVPYYYSSMASHPSGSTTSPLTPSITAIFLILTSLTNPNKLHNPRQSSACTLWLDT